MTEVKHGTGIEWTHGSGYKGETWNPAVGCSKVSEGCRWCYAETVHKHKFGKGINGYPTFKPWTAVNAEHNVTIIPDRLEKPLRWAKPRMVFVNSMSDLFHELLPPKFIAEVFAVMAMADRHVFQVLTKRPDRMAELTNDARFWALVHAAICERKDAVPSFLPGDRRVTLRNVWLGTTIEKAKWSQRADDLRGTPAAVRFISAEPLLGPLVCPLCRGSGSVEPWWGGLPGGAACPNGCADGDGVYQRTLLDDIDWIIVGGESGSHHRPIEEHWVRDLRDACLKTRELGAYKSQGFEQGETAFFFKQWGGARAKSGGRQLAGRTWDEMPSTPSDKSVIVAAT